MRHTSRPPVRWRVNYWPLLTLWLLSGSAGVAAGSVMFAWAQTVK